MDYKILSQQGDNDNLYIRVGFYHDRGSRYEYRYPETITAFGETWVREGITDTNDVTFRAYGTYVASSWAGSYY